MDRVSPETELQPFFREVADIVRGTDSFEVRDGYAFRYWRPLMDANEFCFALWMRDMTKRQRALRQSGAGTPPMRQDDLADLYGVHRTTIYRWFKNADQWEADHPGHRAPLHYFIRINPLSRGRFKGEDGLMKQKRLVYEVEMTTMLIPAHQRYLDSLTDVERTAALADGSIEDIEDLLARFGPRDLGDLPDPPLPPVMQVATLEEEMRVLQLASPMTGQRELHDATLASSPQSLHQLSTGYPPSGVQDATLSLLQDATHEEEEDHDHYYGGEDLPQRDLLFEEMADRLWGLFNPATLYGREIKMRLQLRKPEAFCEIVAAICAEAKILAAEATPAVRNVYARVSRDIKLNAKTEMRIRQPSSFFLVELRRALHLPDYPPGMGDHGKKTQ